MNIFNDIINWTEECDECGATVYEWYDLGTTILCERCLNEFKAGEGVCEVCGEQSEVYKIGNQVICEECIGEFKRS